jgi:hypothetical protein
MEAACASAAGTAPAPQSRARLSELQKDVDGLARLVDAAMAFCRGLELHNSAEEMVSTELKG